jgi:hypothetical protein
MVASAWLERPTMKRTMQHPASATRLSKQHGQEQPATRRQTGYGACILPTGPSWTTCCAFGSRRVKQDYSLLSRA